MNPGPAYGQDWPGYTRRDFQPQLVAKNSLSPGGRSAEQLGIARHNRRIGPWWRLNCHLG